MIPRYTRPEMGALCYPEFVLKPEVGDQRNCEVAWRKGTTIRVRFV